MTDSLLRKRKLAFLRCYDSFYVAIDHSVVSVLYVSG